MSVKLRLARGGAKKRPYYYIVAAHSTSPRDGRYIEQVGTYDPMLQKDNPTRVRLNEDRCKYWLSVGAQPTEPVLKLLKITGDWQKFKGLPGAEGTLKVKEPKPSKLDLFNAALAGADGASGGEAVQLKKKKAPKKADDTAEAPAESESATESAEPAAE